MDDLVARPLSLNIDFWRCNTYVLADACDINQAERLDGSIVHVAEVGHALSGQSSLGHLPGAPPPPDYLRRDCPRLPLALSYGCLTACEVMQTVR